MSGQERGKLGQQHPQAAMILISFMLGYLCPTIRFRFDLGTRSNESPIRRHDEQRTALPPALSIFVRPLRTPAPVSC